MTEQEARAIFTLAGLEVLNIWPTIDGYGYNPSDSRYFETVPRQVWWLVKTRLGIVHIGWRKRVISIDWSDTPIRVVVTADNVTKDDSFVHAWSVEKAIAYLKALASSPALSNGTFEDRLGPSSGRLLDARPVGSSPAAKEQK